LQRGDKPAQAGLPSVPTGGWKLLSGELNQQQRLGDLVAEEPEGVAGWGLAEGALHAVSVSECHLIRQTEKSGPSYSH